MPRGVGAEKRGSYMKLDEEMKIKIGNTPARTELVLQRDTSDFQLRSWNVVPRTYVYASLVPGLHRSYRR